MLCRNFTTLHQLKRFASQRSVVTSAPVRVFSSFYGHEDQRPDNMADTKSPIVENGQEKLSKKCVNKFLANAYRQNLVVVLRSTNLFMLSCCF